MTKFIGVVFADSHYAKLDELTSIRPLAALPVYGRYRIQSKSIGGKNETSNTKSKQCKSRCR